MFDSETPSTRNARFPSPIRQNGRLYFFRRQLEEYKRALAGLPPEPWNGIDALVPAPLVAREFGFGRRTLGRRMKVADAAKAAKHQRDGATLEAVSEQREEEIQERERRLGRTPGALR